MLLNVHTLSAAFSDVQPSVETPVGTIKGLNLEDVGVDAYYGVKYATAQRFQPAQRILTASTTAFNATVPAHIPIQELCTGIWEGE